MSPSPPAGTWRALRDAVARFDRVLEAAPTWVNRADPPGISAARQILETEGRGGAEEVEHVLKQARYVLERTEESIHQIGAPQP